MKVIDITKPLTADDLALPQGMEFAVVNAGGPKKRDQARLKTAPRQPF